MSDSSSQANGWTGRVAAIYARVSSERQRQDETIQSQTVGLRELAADRGLLVPEDLVFEDEGFSGASLTRPALERLRDRAAEGVFEVLLCHAPDRLARRYAYQVLLLEELARVGVEVCFAKEPERGGTPEDELLRQFQGMIAEYERAQIAERTRRGKLHRARGGSQAVMSGAPYGYRYVKKSDHMEGFWEIDEAQAQVVRDVFDRYVTDGVSIGELARWLTERGVQTKTGKTRWDRSTIWAMLRNPAYRGQAAFGKTKTAERHGGPTRTTRQRGERHGRRLTRHDQPAEKWTLIPVPPLVTEETFALAQARLVDNARFSKRNTKELTLLQGVLVCRECGYSCYRTCTRTRTSGSATTAASARTAGGIPTASGAPAARSAPTSSTRSSGRRSDGCSRPPSSSAPRSTAASRRCGPSTPAPAAEKRSSATSPAPPAPSSG